MTRIKCRHCKLPVDLGDDEEGMTCPKCGRYTPRREPPPPPELPPPQSEAYRPGSSDEPEPGNYFAACTLVIAVALVLLGGFLAVSATAADHLELSLFRVGLACFCLLAARIFQTAAYSQWR